MPPRTPFQVVVAAFGVVVVGMLLLLPIARKGIGGAPVLTALDTATSAMCGGTIVVDTSTYWSGFGQIVIRGLVHRQLDVSP